MCYIFHVVCPYLRIAHFLVRVSTLVHQAASAIWSTNWYKSPSGPRYSWPRLDHRSMPVEMPSRSLYRSVINARTSIHAKRVHESMRSWRLIRQQSLWILPCCTRKKLSKSCRGESFPTRAGCLLDRLNVCLRWYMVLARAFTCATANDGICARVYALYIHVYGWTIAIGISCRKRGEINSPILILTDSTTKWLVAWFHQSARVITGVPPPLCASVMVTRAHAGRAVPVTSVLWATIMPNSVSLVNMDWKCTSGRL